MAIWQVAVFKTISCQTEMKLKRAIKLQKPTVPAICYIACWLLCFSILSFRPFQLLTNQSKMAGGLGLIVTKLINCFNVTNFSNSISITEVRPEQSDKLYSSRQKSRESPNQTIKVGLPLFIVLSSMLLYFNLIVSCSTKPIKIFSFF